MHRYPDDQYGVVSLFADTRMQIWHKDCDLQMQNKEAFSVHTEDVNSNCPFSLL